MLDLSKYSTDIFSNENKLIMQQKMKCVQPFTANKQISKLKQAAVLIPLCIYNNKPAILFCMRSLNVRKNRGQVW